jgi:nucleoside-diphosphate-sugar epimerase
MSTVFVTGATGAIGRYVVPDLVAAGHEVTGLARSDEKAAQLAAQGAKPAHVSLFDAEALRDAFAGHDVVANLATSIPQSARRSAWAENDRIRTEGSRAVVDAAIAAGVTRLVQESITFPYADGGDGWIDESSVFDPGTLMTSVVEAETNAERFRASGRAAVVLRFGAFYGPHNWHTDTALRLARRHIGPVMGRPGGYMSWIHLTDAARAVVAALDAPSGTYNVVDDEPVTKREFAAALGDAVGARPRLSIPGRAAKLGGSLTEPLARSQRVSNRRFREVTGWAPRHPNVREGLLTVVKEAPDA